MFKCKVLVNDPSRAAVVVKASSEPLWRYCAVQPLTFSLVVNTHYGAAGSMAA